VKLLWLNHFVPYPPAGGALQRTYHLLRSTASRHEVHLVALNQRRLLPEPDGLASAVRALSAFCASVQVFPLASERTAVDRIATFASAVLGRDPFDVIWLRSDAIRTAIEELRGRHGFDVVHVDTIGLWPAVATLSGLPVVLNHHNIESELVARRAMLEHRRLRSTLFRRESRKLRRLERAAAHQAATNVVVSQLDRERLVAIAPAASIHVTPNGVDTSYFQPTVPTPSDRSLVFAGTLSWFPNRDAIDFLLRDIWPGLLANQPNRRLTLVGRDPPPSVLSSATDPRVIVTGFVSDVRPHIGSAAVYVCPLRVGGGTRLKILDALALGKPVVATAIAVEGLGLVEGVHYLGAETAGDFVGQVERLEADAGLRESLGRQGRQHVVEHYDWNVVCSSLESAFRDATSQARSPHAVATT